MASDVFMDAHYGKTHMGLHIGFPYRRATFDCMTRQQQTNDAERGQRILALRKAKKMDQGQLGALVGVDQSTIHDWEKGKGFNVTRLLALAGALDVTAEYVMLGKDDRFWPFEMVPIHQFITLNDKQKGYVESRLAQAIEEMHAQPKESPPARPPLSPEQAAAGRNRLASKLIAAEQRPARVSKPKGTAPR